MAYDQNAGSGSSADRIRASIAAVTECRAQWTDSERVIGPSFDPDGPGYERAKTDVGTAVSELKSSGLISAVPAQIREPDRMPEPEGRGSPWPVAAANLAGEASPFASPARPQAQPQQVAGKTPAGPPHGGHNPAGPPEDQPGSSQPTQWRMAHIIATRVPDGGQSGRKQATGGKPGRAPVAPHSGRKTEGSDRPAKGFGIGRSKRPPKQPGNR